MIFKEVKIGQTFTILGTVMLKIPSLVIGDNTRSAVVIISSNPLMPNGLLMNIHKDQDVALTQIKEITCDTSPT